MSADASGPGRRLTEDDEHRGAEMYAAGASERDVADALGCSASTAHRLRERLQGASMAALDATAPGTGAEVRDAEVAALRAELAAALAAKRTELGGVLEAWQGRAAASREAVAALDAERVELLAAGKDAAPLRQRRADAVADLADAETAAGLVGAQLAGVDAQLAVLRREDQEEAARAAAEEAAALGDELAPLAAVALREAVTGDGTVKALLAVTAELVKAERASGRSWDALIIPPALPGARDPWILAVWGLWRAARQGDAAGCRQALTRLDGQWQHHRDSEQFRAEVLALAEQHEQRTREGMAAASAMAARQAAGRQTMVSPAASHTFLAEMRGAALRSMAEAERHRVATVEAIRDLNQQR